ncbi:hypothetical protein BHE74_00050615 [Ensete ventricosum]|nr:hypothetical protein BHE74_00050615 [Ensete ventricosum]
MRTLPLSGAEERDEDIDRRDRGVIGGRNHSRIHQQPTPVHSHAADSAKQRAPQIINKRQRRLNIDSDEAIKSPLLAQKLESRVEILCDFCKEDAQEGIRFELEMASNPSG